MTILSAASHDRQHISLFCHSTNHKALTVLKI